MGRFSIIYIILLGTVVCCQLYVVVSAAPRAIAAWKAFLFRRGRKPNEEESKDTADGVESLFAQRLAELRANYVREMSSAIMHAVGLYALLFFGKMAVGKPFVGGGPRPALAIIAYVMMCVVRVCPEVVNRTSLWVLHSLAMCMLTTSGALHAAKSGDAFLNADAWHQIGRLIVAFAYPEAVPNLFWNAAWVIVASVARLSTEEVKPNAAVGNAVAGEIFVAIAVSLLLRRHEQTQISQVVSELAAKGYLRAKATTEKVLANMCDAVVELDGNLHIRKPCPKLVGLLIKPVNARALKGVDFPGLLFDDAEREKFAEFMSPRSVPFEHDDKVDTNENGSSVYVNLRDANGTVVAVQLFHSCHSVGVKDVCHVIGVKEVQDEVGNQPVREQAAVAPAITPRENPGQNANDETESVTSFASSTTQGPTAELMAVIPEQDQMEPVSVMLNPISMQIIGCTSGFKTFVGPLLSGANLQTLVKNMSDFRQWLGNEFNERLSDSDPSKFVLKFAPASDGRNQNFEFRADAFITHAALDVSSSEMGLQVEGDDEEEYEMLCVLALTNVQPHWRLSRRTRRVRNRGGVSSPAEAPSERTVEL